MLPSSITPLIIFNNSSYLKIPTTRYFNSYSPFVTLNKALVTNDFITYVEILNMISISKKYNRITHTTFFILLSLTTLLLGALIYILLRPSEAIFVEWICEIGFEKQLVQLQGTANLQQLSIPNWIIYSLPNGLWAFAYSLLIISIWAENISLIKYFWLTSIPVLILGYELLQLTPIISGTFCVQDIITGIVGILTASLFATKIIKTQNS